MESDQYGKYFRQFLLKHVFIDAKDDFPWLEPDTGKSIINMHNEVIR